MNLSYNFRIGPEAVWLIVNTVIGTALVSLLADLTGLTELPPIGDIQAWAVGFGFGLVRTLLGAILAAATGGGFQAPGEPKPPTA